MALQSERRIISNSVPSKARVIESGANTISSEETKLKESVSEILEKVRRIKDNYLKSGSITGIAGKKAEELIKEIDVHLHSSKLVEGLLRAVNVEHYSLVVTDIYESGRMSALEALLDAKVYLSLVVS